MDEPVNEHALRTILRAALGHAGSINFSTHAHEEMDDDDLSEEDCLRALARGRWDGCDFERGSWRYRWRIPGLVVVVAIESATAVVVVTAWRE